MNLAKTYDNTSARTMVVENEMFMKCKFRGHVNLKNCTILECSFEGSGNLENCTINHCEFAEDSKFVMTGCEIISSYYDGIEIR